MALEYAMVMHFMSLFIGPCAWSFILLYLVIYGRYEEARDTTDLSGSLVLHFIHFSISRPQNSFLLYHVY